MGMSGHYSIWKILVAGKRQGRICETEKKGSGNEYSYVLTFKTNLLEDWSRGRQGGGRKTHSESIDFLSHPGWKARFHGIPMQVRKTSSLISEALCAFHHTTLNRVFSTSCPFLGMEWFAYPHFNMHCNFYSSIKTLRAASSFPVERTQKRLCLSPSSV